MKTKIKMKYILICSIIIIGALSGCVGKSTEANNANDQYQNVEKNTAGTYKATQNVQSNDLTFVLIGDPHIKSHNIDTGGNARLAQIVNYTNTLNIDFAVFLGDMADDGKNKTDDIVVKILNNMTHPYYVVAGNHDIFVSPQVFESHFGPMEHIENVKGYQLLFAGIWNETVPDKNGKPVIKLHWSFDFNGVNKSMPTLMFLHGPTMGPPPDCSLCKWGEFFGYAESMQPELDKFSNLKGVFSGHVHFDSNQTFNGVRYVTVNGLVTTNAGGISAVPSDNIGYITIKNGTLDYGLVQYN